MVLHMVPCKSRNIPPRDPSKSFKEIIEGTASLLQNEDPELQRQCDVQYARDAKAKHRIEERQERWLNGQFTGKKDVRAEKEKTQVGEGGETQGG
jgi:hypothetical protein